MSSLCCRQWVVVEEGHGEDDVDRLSLGQVDRLELLPVVGDVHLGVGVDLRIVISLQEKWMKAPSYNVVRSVIFLCYVIFQSLRLPSLFNSI